MRGEGRILLLGDFNCIIEERDAETNTQRKLEPSLEVLTREFNLVDVWRERNPNKVEYTWGRPGSGSSRLDRGYLSRELLVGVTQVEHLVSTSDHKAVWLEMEVEDLHLPLPPYREAPGLL